MAEPDVSLPPGSLIGGKYRVERPIGRGGMGSVVAATHVELDQRVAIKVLHASAAKNPDFVARFSREARAAAKINSRHVARVTDVGTLDQGVPYIVMEYLEGEDLSALLARQGALSIHVAIDYLLQACEAIAAAHAMGIVHRDLKPANIFLARQPDRSSIIKILDFGVSKVTRREQKGLDDDAQSVTKTGEIFGSPTYMSPEQLRASGRVDSRADIWALGVVLYELLTNSLPFWRGSVAETVACVIRDPAPKLRDVLPTAPEELELVVARCLEKEAPMRYASIAELARALMPFARSDATELVERLERMLAAGAITQDVDVSASAPSRSEHADAMTPRSRSPVTPSGLQAGQSTLEPTADRSGGGSESSDRAIASVPAPRRRSIAYVALGSVVVLGAVIVTLMRSPAPGEIAAPNTSLGATSSAAPTSPTAPTSVATSAPPPALTSAQLDAGSADASPTEITLMIREAPPGTKVFSGNSQLGTAPGALHLPRGALELTLRFVCDGYKTTEMTIVPDADRSLSLNMPRSSARPGPALTTKPPKDLEPF